MLISLGCFEFYSISSTSNIPYRLTKGYLYFFLSQSSKMVINSLERLFYCTGFVCSIVNLLEYICSLSVSCINGPHH